MKITTKKFYLGLLVCASICLGIAIWNLYEYYTIQSRTQNAVLKKVHFELKNSIGKLIGKNAPAAADVQQLSNAIGENGFLFILSPDGTILMHPKREYVTKNIKSIARIEKNKKLQANISAFLENSSPEGSFESKSLQGNEITIYGRTPQSGIILAAKLYTDDTLYSVMSHLRQLFIIITIALVFMLLLFAAVFYLWYRPGNHGTRILLTLVFITLVSGIGLLWHNEQKSITIISKRVKPITNQQVFEKFIDKLKKNSATHDNFIIKTGIFLNSIQYITTDQLNITGYIWQIYPINLPKDIEKDFLLPDCEKYEIKDKISHEKKSDEERIVWFFSGVFNQKHLSAIYFPFDDQDINLEFRHPSLNPAVLLVPDLATYHPFIPRYLPGIQHMATQSDRFFVESFFAYHTSAVKTVDQLLKKIPKTIKLNFVVIAGRGLIGIIITYLLPVLIALATLYACLILATRGTDQIQTAALASGTFLAITLLHGTMRSAIGVPGTVTYLEYYYLLLYVICGFVMAYILMYKSKLTQLFEAQDALLIRRLFFPAYLFIMFIITAIVFY